MPGTSLTMPANLSAWRRETREALIQKRQAAPLQERLRWTQAILQNLTRLLPNLKADVLGFCWPYKAEVNVVPAVREWVATGKTAALPVVVQPRTPMVFRRWHPDVVMTLGVYDIPIPTGTDEVVPEVLLVPLNGIDPAYYRLGYGGGYFDRTVVTLEPRPLMIGVSFELSRLPTIYPQPHDQPMDIVVTESGIFRRDAGD